jgi:hypothetical protein
MAPDIDEVGRGGHIAEKSRPVGPAEGGVVFPAEGTYVIIDPPFVSEFESVTDGITDKQGQELLQPVRRRTEGRWKLPECDLELASERQGPPEKAFEGLFNIDQALDMRYEPAAFQGEGKVPRRLIAPPDEGLFERQTVERDIQLDGAKDGAVILEPSPLRQAVRIECPRPVGIGETAASYMNRGHALL